MGRELREGENEVEEERELGGKREKPVVRPEEIPPVPENRFLLRRDMPSQEDKADMSVQSCASCIYLFFLMSNQNTNLSKHSKCCNLISISN